MLSSFDLESAKGLPLFFGRFFLVGLDLLGFTKDLSPTVAFSEDDIAVTPDGGSCVAVGLPSLEADPEDDPEVS